MIAALPYIAGIACSLCYGAATVVEQIVARQHKTMESFNILDMASLFSRIPYIASMLLDLAGWALFIFCARRLPLFLALSFVVLSLAVTIVIAYLYMHTKTSISMKSAVALLIVGTALIGLAARQSSANMVSHHFNLAVELAILPILLIGLALLKSKEERYTPLMLSILAGLSFGGTALLARVINISSFSFGQIFQISVLSLALYGILGSVLFAAALQREDINVVSGVLYSSEFIVPSILGILFLGDNTKTGLWPALLIGYVFIVVSTGIISLNSENKRNTT